MSKSKTKRRYVYLMERVSQREWKSIRQGRREIKIGISNDTNERLKQVTKGIPGRFVLLDKFIVDSASKVERQLQKMFDDHNFKAKGAKRGSGATELYRLKNRDIRHIRSILRQKERRSMPKSMKILMIVLIAIIFYLNKCS